MRNPALLTALFLGMAGIATRPWTSFREATKTFATERLSVLQAAGSENNPPKVKIMAPGQRETYAWGSLAPYQVRVSDKEDGDSEYEEIPEHEVYLEIRYFPDSSNLPAYIRQQPYKEPFGLKLMKTSDCFNCHKMNAPLIGPSFLEIAQRYAGQDDQAGILSQRILHGSTGVWGNNIMTSHPSFAESETLEMVKWIMENGISSQYDIQRGTKGAFKLSAPPDGTKHTRGGLLLTATYLDHGVDGDTAQSLAGADFLFIPVK